MVLLLRVVIFLIGAFSMGYSHAQTIKGSIRSGNAFIAGATVIFGTAKTLTDSNGVFSIPFPGVGKYRAQISSVGYQTLQQTIHLLDSSTVLSFTLQPEDKELDAVVITGTMRTVKRLESPIAVEVYSPQFFKKNPSPSIFEALQNVNGVRPQINCNVCNTGDIHINGLEGPYTMVTIDGMPIVSSLSSVYGLFGIPSQLIERVEIVKGPASGLYGSEAIGGLINIITKSPEKAPRFSAAVFSTTWGEHNADLGGRFKWGKATSIVGVNYFNYTNPIDRNGDHFTDATLQHRATVFNKWSWNRKENKKFTLAGRYFYEDRWGGETDWKQYFRGGDSVYGESIYTSRWELIGHYDLPVKENIALSFSATAHDQNSFYGNVPYVADQKIGFGQLLWNKEVGSKNNLLLGVAGRYNYYDDNSTATIDTATKLNSPERFFLPGAFAQNEWRINERHTLLAGLRYDYHKVHKSILTPRVAYKWTWRNGDVVRVNAGTGFRVVNLFTEEHAALTGSRAVEVKSSLKPEKSFNINGNYSKTFGDRSLSVVMDAAVWYSRFSNQIIPDYDTDPNKIIYDNLSGHSLSKGATLNLELNVRQRLKGIVGATVQDVARIDKIDGKTTKVQPVLTEKWSGTWTLSYHFPIAGISIDYTGNVYGPMRLPLVSLYDPRPPYSKVWSLQNIQWTKSLGKDWELFGGIKNLFNWTPAKDADFIIARAHDPFDKKVQTDNAGNIIRDAENPYGLTFDPSYVYAPNQGRRGFAGFRVSIK